MKVLCGGGGTEAESFLLSLSRDHPEAGGRLGLRETCSQEMCTVPLRQRLQFMHSKRVALQ